MKRVYPTKTQISFLYEFLNHFKYIYLFTEYEMSEKLNTRCTTSCGNGSATKVSVGTQTNCNGNGCLGSTNIELVINSWDKDIQL